METLRIKIKCFCDKKIEFVNKSKEQITKM